MTNEELKAFKAKYKVDRVGLIRMIKQHRIALKKIALEGIDTEDEVKIARAACSILASDLFHEESVMKDKTGETNDRDEIDDFLDGLSRI